MSDLCEVRCSGISDRALRAACGEFGEAGFLFVRPVDSLDELLSRDLAIDCVEYLRGSVCTEALAYYDPSDDSITYITDRIDEFINRLTNENLASVAVLVRKYVGNDSFIKYVVRIMWDLRDFARSIVAFIVNRYVKSHEHYHWAGAGSLASDEEALATAYGLYVTTKKYLDLIRDAQVHYCHCHHPDGIFTTAYIGIVPWMTIIRIALQHMALDKYRGFVGYVDLPRIEINGYRVAVKVGSDVVMEIIYYPDHIHSVGINLNANVSFTGPRRSRVVNNPQQLIERYTTCDRGVTIEEVL